MSGPSRSNKERAPLARQPSKKTKPGDSKADDDDGKMHHWGWGWGNVVGVIPCDPNPRVSVPWNEKSKFIHYVDRSGNVTSKLRPESESSASEGAKDKSQANVLRRLHRDEVVMSDDVETPSGSGKGKKPETKAETPGGEKLGKETKKAKRYIYIDRHGVISYTGVRLSKASAGRHFIYRDGEISLPEEEEEDKASKAT